MSPDVVEAMSANYWREHSAKTFNEIKNGVKQDGTREVGQTSAQLQIMQGIFEIAAVLIEIRDELKRFADDRESGKEKE